MKSEFLILGLLLLPSLAFANVIINEIAWMGITGNQYGEWIELYNNSNEEIDLNNWKLYEDGGNVLIFTLTKKITPNGYLVIERTTDSSPDPLPGINDESGKFGGSGLVNLPGGEYLVLKDSASNIIEDLNFSTGWPAGDNTTKQTMQLTSSGWITATATPKAVNAGVLAPSEQESQPQQSQSQSSSGGNLPPYIPPELLPKIKAYAGEDKTVTVGASAEFRGQAFGLENEPLDNARYLWTFGDGASKEGKNITHVYQYPGEYIVSLNISSGEYSASDYMLVKAVPNQVFISEIKTGTDSFIELENKSKEEIDISGCQIKYNNPPSGEAGQTFIFPQSTRIRSNAFLVIPSSVSGINLLQGKGLVEFLYSGGFKADSFGYNGFLQAGQSFNRANESSPEGKQVSYGVNLIGSETPSAKNSTPTPFEVGVPASPAGRPTSPTEASESVGVSKSSDQKTQDKNPAQAANIITVGDSDGTKSNTKIYLLAVLGLVVLSAGTILFIRRKGLTKI